LTNDDKKNLCKLAPVLIESPTLQAHGYDWKLKFYAVEIYNAPLPYAEEFAFTRYLYVDLTLEDEGVVVSVEPESRIRVEPCHASDEALAEEIERDQAHLTDEVMFRANATRTIKYHVKANKCVVNLTCVEEPEHLNCVVDLVHFYEPERLNYEINVDIEFLSLQKQVWFPKKPQREETSAKETSNAIFGGFQDMHKNVLFRLIKHNYTVGSPDLKWSSCKWDHWSFDWTLDQHKELLVVADRFKCNDFKIYVESRITFHFLTKENALQLLIFANSYSCALLWEAAVKEFVRDAEAVKKSEAWSRVVESNQLLVKLLDDVIPKRGANAIKMMDIAALRNELECAGLALDGSRDALVNRLETHRNMKSEMAHAFTQLYYSIFYSNVDGLSEFFNNKSMMTFQGEKVRGQHFIMQKLKSLGAVKHTPKTMDCQPSIDRNSLLIFVTGTIVIGDLNANPFHFNEFFHLVSTVPGLYCVHNIIFCLNYGRPTTGGPRLPDDDISL